MGKLYQRTAVKSYQLGLLQSRAHRAVNTFMTAYLANLDLSLPEWSLMGILKEKGGLQPAKIAGILGVKPPVATTLISGLERKGLVCRGKHEHDSRSAVITLSQKGENVMAATEKLLSKELRAFLGDLALPEIMLYMRVLAKLAAKL